jgi:alpha-L-rhamnosidase
MTKDKYGDWCVPPESKELIHSKDSTRNTDGQLIATAYYYKLLQLMQRFAAISGNQADINEYVAQSGKVKEAFNNRFLSLETKKYGNNTVTANLLPLSFGMVPDSLQQKVFDNMMDKIKADNYHLSSGVIGIQWLMRTLSQMGRTEVAYRIDIW